MKHENRNPSECLFEPKLVSVILRFVVEAMEQDYGGPKGVVVVAKQQQHGNDEGEVKDYSPSP